MSIACKRAEKETVVTPSCYRREPDMRASRPGVLAVRSFQVAGGGGQARPDPFLPVPAVPAVPALVPEAEMEGKP